MNNRKNAVFAAFALLFGISLCVGRYPLTLSALFCGDALAVNVFWTLRVPRTLMAAAGGFALAVAGYVYQTIFHNPLAAPDIIGVSSGACAGAAIAILFLGGGAIATAAMSFAGGLCATMLALALAYGAQQKTSSFVLAGIAVNALMGAVLMLLKALADPERELASIEYWTMGSLSGMTASKLPFALTLIAVGSAAVFLLYRQLLLLSAQEAEAMMLGVPVRLMRGVLLSLATLIVAAVVSVTGLISFIGLLAPHFARLCTKDSRAGTCFLGGIWGGTLLLAADCVARVLTELPVSVFTSLLGAPFLIYLIHREERVP